MKTLTVEEARGNLNHLLGEACHGEIVVLTDGQNEVTLEPRRPLDLEEDSPDLEVELLKGVRSPSSPYSSAEFRAIADEIIRRKQPART